MPLDLVKSDVAEGATNTPRPLTQPSDSPEGGLAVDATQPLEEWRPVLGYEGLYEVSDQGRVKSLRRRPLNGRNLHGYHMTQRKNNGYRFVQLTRDGTHKSRPVHQLVLEAFVGPRPSGQVTRHLNAVRHDNRLPNLTWGTYSENFHDRHTAGVPVKRGGRQLWNR